MVDAVRVAICLLDVLQIDTAQELVTRSLFATSVVASAKKARQCYNPNLLFGFHERDKLL